MRAAGKSGLSTWRSNPRPRATILRPNLSHRNTWMVSRPENRGAGILSTATTRTSVPCETLLTPSIQDSRPTPPPPVILGCLSLCRTTRPSSAGAATAMGGWGRATPPAGAMKPTVLAHRAPPPRVSCRPHVCSLNTPALCVQKWGRTSLRSTWGMGGRPWLSARATRIRVQSW